MPVGIHIEHVVLTLDPKRFASPRLCFVDMGKNHRVSRAVRAWARAYGFNPHGAWLCKLELHKSGFPHYHVYVDVPDWVRLPLKGAFDRFWRFGFSHVEHRVQDLRYPCKVTAYACKEATAGGEAGDVVLERSGLPWDGFKWVTTARDYWRSYGCPDDWESDLAEAWPDESEAVEPSIGAGGHPGRSHADRVRECGEHCELVVDGVVGQSFPVVLRLAVSRAEVCRALAGAAFSRGQVVSAEYFPSGTLRAVTFPHVGFVREVLSVLFPRGSPDLAESLSPFGWVASDHSPPLEVSA